MREDQPQLRKPSRIRLVDDVVHILEEAILSGEAAPGTRLVEEAISKQLSVSRTTVREALLMLERSGLVVSRPRGGTFVTRISTEDALDLGYTRALLESYAVMVGFERVTPALLDAMDADIAEMSTCQLPRELPRLLRIDLRFHRRLMECARMPRLLQLWSSLDAQIGALYIRAIEQQMPTIDFIVSFHRQFVDALRTGERAAARQAVLHHYVRFYEPADARVESLEMAVETLVAAGRG
jgi:DNA-binding GntR family transcriptional regulator